MKKFLVTLVLLSLAAAQVQPVDRSSVGVNISATVVDNIEMFTLNGIDVGTIQPSQLLVRLDPRLEQGAGTVKFQGRANSLIRVTYTQQVVMVNSITNHSLTVLYNLSGNPNFEQSASIPITENPITVSLSNMGEYYIWIGCFFSLDGITTGQYDGDFVIEVEYN
ncbi:MAG: hypothetical protein ABIA75_00425 [Candidatus Neomarinimicrobiota bacterium]